MILLFEAKPSCADYWLNNTVVDCGKSEEQSICLDISITDDNIDDILLDDSDFIDFEFSPVINNSNKLNSDNKKLNKKSKQIKLTKINEQHQTVYIRRNPKIINGNSRKENSRCNIRGFNYKDNDSDFGINDLQKTIKHKCVHNNIDADNNERKMRKMS